ncbi:MAG: ABC transporter permease [Anaerolineae bacterium]|nr:ABC transporter permease [Anaerolineae bacterium]
MIFKNLLGRKIRTLLTMLGIAVGVAAVVSLGALAEGLVSAYSTLGGGSGADILVMQDDALDIVFSAVDQEIAPLLAGFSGVEKMAQMVYTFGATDEMPYFIVYGYEPGSFAIERFKIVEGQTLSYQLGKRGGKPLLLGKSAADDLEKQVGDTFRLYETTYRIVGIYETGQPFEDGAAIVLLEDAQLISGKPRQINAFLLKVRVGTDIAHLRERIEQRFDTLTATTSADFEDEQDTLQYIYAYTWSVSLIAILIGGVGVMNTMLMSVFERTREFGVLRAVGWRPRRVLRMVLGESLLLSLIGGGVGIGLGTAAVWGVQQLPLAAMIVPKAVSINLLLQGVGIALGLGLIGGGLPAWRAARLMPADAMRYEGASVNTSRHVRSSALRNVLRQPVRTLLTIIGIGIAMMSIVLLGALSAGMVDAISGMIIGGGAQLVGMQSDASIDLSQVDEGIIRRIGAFPGVQAAEGFLTGYTSMGDLPFFIVFGYQPRGLSITEFRIVDGQPLLTNRQMLLGRVAAENLDKEIGQTLQIFNSTFKIVGIYETGVSFQDGGAVVSLRDAQKLFGQAHKVSFLGVWVEEPDQVDRIRQEIETHFPEVSLSQAAEFAENVGDIQMMESAIWGISFMALVVGGLGMMNTMVMSVFERTREIGVLRALGWRKRRVLWMIVRESVTLSLLGGVTGVVIGVALGYGLNLLPVIQGMIRMTYSVGLFLQATGTALVLGIIGGIYPAWRASNLPPVEALRYE